MAILAAPDRAQTPPLGARVRRRLRGVPTWAVAGAVLVVLLAVSVVIRTRALGAGFWMDEALSVGIASHPLSAIPGVLRHDGSPPLFYLLLHGWMTLFGASESATHVLSLVFALACIPVGMWAGWSLFGRRAGYMAAALFAFSAFLTQYGQETRMYTMMAFFGLVATAAYLHAFVFRRRGYLILFAVAEALMLYTHAWGIFYGVAAIVALVPIWLSSEDRRGIVRDALLAFVGAGVLFLPWLPNFLYQTAHTAAPWDPRPRFGGPIQVSRNVLGGDRVTIVLLIATVMGAWQLGRRSQRRTPQALALWSLILLAVVTLACGWLASQITPAWVPRYFAPVLAPLLLLAAFGCARARAVGIVAVLASLVFLANPTAFATEHKSDVRDIGGEMTPLVHPGDLVIVTQPEQTSLAWYYLPEGLRYANTIGPVPDPRYMNWVNAVDGLKNPNWRSVETSLIASVKPGQQILFIRPLTEGETNWDTTWTELVRRRSAQWGVVLQSDPQLKPVAWAPHTYRGACCVADSAVLFKKVK